MKDGFIFLFRRFLNWGWFQDDNMVRIFIYLLLKANYEDSQYRGHDIKRGQLVFGRLQAAKDLRKPPSTIYKCLKRLQSSGEICMEGNNKFSIITICNYDKYQSVKEKTEQQGNNKRTTGEQPKNNKRTTEEQQRNTYKEDNNIISKEEKETNTYVSEFFSFQDFWKIYDKNIAEQECSQWWKKISEAEKELIRQSLPAYIEATPDKKFRKDPLHYLVGKGWLNEVIKPGAAKSAVDLYLESIK